MRRWGPGVALGVLVLVDVLRVWLPSIITIFGQAAATPAELLGAFALFWFVLGLAGPALCRWLGPALVGAAAAVVLAGCRVLLVGVSGPAQLYVASAGLLAGLWWLSAVSRQGRPVVGVALGLALAALEHAALGTFDATWRAGFAGWLLAVLVAGAFVVVVLTIPVGSAVSNVAGWWLVGPVVFLALQYALSPAMSSAGVSYVSGRDGVAVEPGAFAAPASTAVAVLLFLGLVRWAPRGMGVRVAGAVALVCSAVLLRYPGGPLLPVAVLLGAAGLGTCFGAVVGGAAPGGAVVGGAVVGGAVAGGRSGAAGRGGLAVVGSMLGFAVAVFAYYAAYDLGYPNGWLPPVLALVVGGVAVGVRGGAGADRPAVPRYGLAVAALVVVVVAGLGAWTPRAQGVRPAPSGPGQLRVVAYNVRMGFGLDGRFSVVDLARVIRAQRPDVVLLSEVDRGWLLNGGHDDLAVLARLIGLPYVFAPAADPVWGDAVLTALPVVSVRTRALPARGAPTGAQVLGVVVRHHGVEVAVVSTHLQPPPDGGPVEQAEAVARFADSFGAGRPTVVGGDFNTEPGDPAFAALTAHGLVDAFAAARPVRTSPADRPRTEIDHMFLRGATARDVSAPRSTASDHLPVAATITW